MHHPIAVMVTLQRLTNDPAEPCQPCKYPGVQIRDARLPSVGLALGRLQLVVVLVLLLIRLLRPPKKQNSSQSPAH